MNISQPEGNFYDKYGSNNKIVKKIMQNFFCTIKEMLQECEDYESVLEAGCGEGVIADFIYHNSGKKLKINAFDISDTVIEKAKQDYPYIHFFSGSVYSINGEDNSYDLVVASEVLEHLEQPQKALQELIRVSKKYILLSVPNEPIWRILNMCRGKYINQWGNTPGHIQHFSKKTFSNLCSVGGGGGTNFEFKIPPAMDNDFIRKRKSA